MLKFNTTNFTAPCQNCLITYIHANLEYLDGSNANLYIGLRLLHSASKTGYWLDSPEKVLNERTRRGTIRSSGYHLRIHPIYEVCRTTSRKSQSSGSTSLAPGTQRSLSLLARTSSTSYRCLANPALLTRYSLCCSICTTAGSCSRSSRMDSRSARRSAGTVRQANFNNTSASHLWMRRGARPAVLGICTLPAHAKR
jgi:hypothetical protein